eukprot:151004_1
MYKMSEQMTKWNDNEFDECDIIDINQKELKKELCKNNILCNCCTLYLFYKSISFISCLFIICGFIGILIGNLMLNLENKHKEEIEYWSLLDISYILNTSMLCIIFGIYGMFIFECNILRPIYFSLYFWWTIISLIIFITFTLICINWKYWKHWWYYLIFVPIYILYFCYIYGTHQIYSIIKYLTIIKNNDIEKIEIIKKYSISHISIGIIINVCLIFLYLLTNNLYNIRCEFISSTKIISNLLLQCEALTYSTVYINNINNNIYNNHYYKHKQQMLIGVIWICFGILSFVIGIISFIILWKSHNYYYSMICSILSLILSFISYVIWMSMDNVCNDQTCIYYANNVPYTNKNINRIITKHILFLNSTTICIISCLIWCIIIWFLKQKQNEKYTFPLKH